MLNHTLYAISKTDKAQIKAMDIIVGDIFIIFRNKIPDDPTRTEGLYSLVLHVVTTAAKCDLATNINVTDGLTNGADCVIKNFDYRVRKSTRHKLAQLEDKKLHMWHKKVVLHWNKRSSHDLLG